MDPAGKLDEVHYTKMDSACREGSRTPNVSSPLRSSLQFADHFISEVPSSRVREAERKLQLVNDAQAKEFSTSRVICKVCEASVALSEKIPYDLRNWQDHKLTCVVSVAETDDQVASATPIPVTPSARPPPSTASTETTIVNPSASSSPPQPATGQKRTREEEEEGEDGPRSVRPRTETYIPSDEKPPGLWGWFMLPWQTFKRGFAEGLWSSPNASTS